MVKKIYKCRECGAFFPKELSELIEKKTQIYCERCGNLFSLEGVSFKVDPSQYKKKGRLFHEASRVDRSALDNLIQSINKISFIPLLIYSIVSLILIFEIFYYSNWLSILFHRLLVSTIGFIICYHDLKFISPKVNERRYDEIIVDALCWGILGCFIFGTGVLILIKGVFIVFCVISKSKKENLSGYDFLLLLKDSLNNFSAKAGFVIFLLVLNGVSLGFLSFARFNIYTLPSNAPPPTPLAFLIPLILFISLSGVIIVLLLVDFRAIKKFREKTKFEFSDFLTTFILGVFCTAFYAIGIFILLKGVVILFLYMWTLSATQPTIQKEEQLARLPPQFPPEIEPEKVYKQPTPTYFTQKPRVEKKEEVIKKEVIKAEKPEKIKPKEEARKKEKEIQLKLHESLLPVKDEKDKKVVKQYFTKIFTILNKDLRKQINDLKISKKEKKELLQELSFLTREEQVKYIYTLINLYQEIPKKLIERIRKLPNVKPNHYDKIVEQLKYMDIEEQFNFVKFLEKMPK